VTRSCIYHSVVYIHGRIALANATDELTLADARQLPSRIGFGASSSDINKLIGHIGNWMLVWSEPSGVSAIAALTELSYSLSNDINSEQRVIFVNVVDSFFRSAATLTVENDSIIYLRWRDPSNDYNFEFTVSRL